ncbi:hypothetical protein SAMN04488598_105130 [Halanaerobium congolense]|uniref:Uncharacterized protein n=1 Tax=Halanaerobium congolense TaxID=54121 RepID=A0A1G8ISM6_9FIRM|nr:hypothetical protein [Halanaerobium congolense]PUU90398.1 MAG: hypothetical protein CI948_1562 [Halanaerobium sp.]PTX15437.1 hypothetical protein C7953_0072 [Halanaerobium congolense]SDF06182.1 hypothetical protein SAMN04488598_105130 [Halanaerobium congolense]SDI21919.1 hypothetical protein SAMN04515654_10358 [Halanaerobium congolense]SES65120.1 hypothetical protein SAMN04515653_101125 [Halanaerobium congolense]
MNFVRSGPRYLFLKVKSPKLFCQELSRKTKLKKLNFQTAIKLAAEESVIVFLSDYNKDSFKVEDSDLILYLPLNSTALLAMILNQHELSQVVEKVTTGPGQLVMRIPDQGEKVIEEIAENYQAEEMSILEAIDKGNTDSTIISFTDQPIKSRLKSLKKVRDNILVAKNSTLVFEELRRDAVRYITHGLENHQWSELKINIYDSDELYELEYKRLITILSDLEAGIILGESWTKDHAFALFSITAYQIRLFTFLEPIEIKKILFAFEYNSDGERLVDYDLFNKSNKINWSEILNDGKYHDRKELAFSYREKIMKELSESAKKRYFDIEKEITAQSNK